MRPTVLVVDPHPGVRHALRVVLETAGYTVLTAPDGARALSLLRRHPVRAVLAELHLPDKDGWAFRARVRQEHPCLPVALMAMDVTATGGPTLPPAPCHLIKPFTVDALFATLARLLAHPCPTA